MTDFINNTFLNYANIILGIIVILICLYGDIPSPHNTIWLYCMPLLIFTNYVCLMWLTKRNNLQEFQ